MPFRDDLIAIVDDVRQSVLVDCTQRRFRAVTLRRVTWAGTELGDRGPDDEDPLVLDIEVIPRPRVRDLEPRLVQHQGGVFERGDRIVDRVSATYTEAQLTGRPLERNEQLLWVVDGDTYVVVSVTEGYVGWRVHLRRSGRP